jgi:3-isopropylmalate/(R)-2-methylmalate dehydratase large subunit
MTITEKILAAHAGLAEVVPGQLIECDLDLVLANDVTAPISIKEFAKIGTERVWDPTKVALVPDHYTPNKDIKSAEQAKMVREFARAQGITHYYEIGCMGVEHALLPEQGVVGAGDVIIGADSHTCTYGALGAFATGVGGKDLLSVGHGTGHGRAPSGVNRGACILRHVGSGRPLLLSTLAKVIIFDNFTESPKAPTTGDLDVARLEGKKENC